MSTYTNLRKRIEALPPEKAREYGEWLDRLSTRSTADPDWQTFLSRLQRAEHLASRMHYSSPARMRRGTH